MSTKCKPRKALLNENRPWAFNWNLQQISLNLDIDISHQELLKTKITCCANGKG